MVRPKESRRRVAEACGAASDCAASGSSSAAEALAKSGDGGREAIGFLRERLDVLFGEEDPSPDYAPCGFHLRTAQNSV